MDFERGLGGRVMRAWALGREAVYPRSVFIAHWRACEIANSSGLGVASFIRSGFAWGVNALDGGLDWTVSCAG